MTHTLSMLTAVLATPLFAWTEPPKTGSYALTFSERSPVSSGSVVAKRLGLSASQRTPQAEEYDVEKESFEVYVPKSYTADKPFGLLVFISPGGNGGVKKFDRDGGWTKALDKREIIWVGPNNAGNDRQALARIGLALDAAHNMPKKFKIDPERVYIGGVSGGGRITSLTLLPFPEVFTGGYSIIGADFYRNLPSKEKGGMYAGVFKQPPPKTLALAKKRRFVLLTGDADANREQMQTIYQVLKRDGWKHLHYFQVPGMGHVPPDGEWFAKGLAALDGGEATPAGDVSEKPSRSRPERKDSAKKPTPP
jgi:dienelactone hydrolase